MMCSSDATTEKASEQASLLLRVLSPEFAAVPDLNGGVVVAQKTSTGEDIFHAHADGSLEYQRWRDGVLVLQRWLSGEPVIASPIGESI